MCTFLFSFVAFPHIHDQDPPKVYVPSSHVIWVGISGSVVDAHVLVGKPSGLELENISGSLQGDNTEPSSAAKDWVQGAMSAAYPGA